MKLFVRFISFTAICAAIFSCTPALKVNTDFDIVDAATTKVIWMGTERSEIDGALKDPDVEIPAAIAKIMASFPPGPPGTPLP